MAFEIVRSLESDRDLRLIVHHLVDSYVGLGEALPDAIERASERARMIEAEIDTIARAPHQGTLLPYLGPTVRNVTKNRAVFYFDVDDSNRSVRILAIFFGGQNHRDHILKRLGRGG
jgi:plasmid stabilization system protein ParE